MDWSGIFMNPATLGMMIPIVAIIGWAAITITKMIIEHRERLAMIQRGMIPGAPPVDPNVQRVP